MSLPRKEAGPTGARARTPRLVAAPDKFRGTASAREVAEAIARAGTEVGWEVTPQPLSDGGEGLLDALSTPDAALRRTDVTGPDGRTVRATWELAEGRAVVEMAEASGLLLVGGPAGNDPVRATSRGTGELIAVAAQAVGSGGTVVVGLGGSASTDGGLGALEAVEEAGGIRGAAVIGACDVATRFVDAAAWFGPQKGAGPSEVAALTRRLSALAERYRVEYGVDVRGVAGTGAAGGMGGAILAMGGELRSGYALVAELVGLRSTLAGAELVVTGEGHLDAASFEGKVVGGVIEDAAAADAAVLVVVGRADDDASALAREKGAELVVLTEREGERRAMRHAAACVEEVVRERLASRTEYA